MRRVLVVVAVLGVVGVSCATSGPGGGGGGGNHLPPPPVLGGFTKIARTWSSGPNVGPPVGVSPSTRYLVYQTDATFPPDVDPYPNQRNLYELDRQTGINHLISPWLATAVDNRDDGAVLVSYRDSEVAPLHPGLYTIDGGLVPLTVPMDSTGCDLRFETGGPGFELTCDGTDDRALGLYRFEVGDVTATPVATVAGLPPEQRKFYGISSNRRFFEVGDSDLHWVYDAQAETMFPHSFQNAWSVPVITTNFTRFNNVVGDDGRLLIQREVWVGTLHEMGGAWFDPRDGSHIGITAFPDMSNPLFPEGGTSLFAYEDFSPEIGHNYFVDHRAPVSIPILADFASPTRRWQLPQYTRYLVAIGSDGSLIMTSPPTTEPGETDPGVDIYVREGPLP